MVKWWFIDGEVIVDDGFIGVVWWFRMVKNCRGISTVTSMAWVWVHTNHPNNGWIIFPAKVPPQFMWRLVHRGSPGNLQLLLSSYLSWLQQEKSQWLIWSFRKHQAVNIWFLCFGRILELTSQRCGQNWRNQIKLQRKWFLSLCSQDIRRWPTAVHYDCQQKMCETNHAPLCSDKKAKTSDRRWLSINHQQERERENKKKSVIGRQGDVAPSNSIQAQGGLWIAVLAQKSSCNVAST